MSSVSCRKAAAHRDTGWSSKYILVKGRKFQNPKHRVIYEGNGNSGGRGGAVEIVNPGK
jgi:hypothetical protein